MALNLSSLLIQHTPSTPGVLLPLFSAVSYTHLAAELLECFQWCDDNFNLQHVKEELADVLVYSQNLLDKLGLDADEIVNMKMDQNEAKCPVEKAKGSAAKYTEL